jgi:hypothetical protein
MVIGDEGLEAADHAALGKDVLLEFYFFADEDLFLEKGIVDDEGDALAAVGGVGGMQEDEVEVAFVVAHDGAGGHGDFFLLLSLERRAKARLRR